MSEPIFKNKDGSLTRYALACGYIECKELSNNIRITLELDGNSYAVKAFDHNNHIRLAWDNFDSIVQARKRYKELIRLHKLV